MKKLTKFFNIYIVFMLVLFIIIYISSIQAKYTSSSIIANNINLTILSRKYNLIFDANAGIFDDGKSSKSIAVYTLDDVPTPSLQNCTFIGWYAEKEPFSQIKITNDNINKYENNTIYAHWSCEWNVTINSNGGKLYVKDSSIIPGASEKNPILSENPKFKVRYYDGAYNNLLITAEKEGYQFTGIFDEQSGGNQVWNADGPSNNNGIYYAYKGGSRGAVWINNSKVKDSTFVFYPQWKANTYYIEYNANASDVSGTTEKSEHIYDVKKTLNPNSFKRNGYIFMGWNTKSDGTGTFYEDREEVENLTIENNAIVNLYAQWGLND